MKTGTKSLLFGVHQVVLHPLIVWRAWVRLYGLRRVTCRVTGLRVSALDPRLWLCILVHDLGYWGAPDMDGDEGKWHPVLGARIVSAALAERSVGHAGCRENDFAAAMVSKRVRDLGPWGLLVLLHSRSVAHRLRMEPSVLAAPDKLALSLYPKGLYLRLARWSGELWEYMEHGRTAAARERGIDARSPGRWFDSCSHYMATVAHRMVAGGPAGTPPEDGGRP